MAHRLQRGAVRGGRHAAGGRARALPRAALLLVLLAGPAAAQRSGAGRAALETLALGDGPEWWSEVGRSGGGQLLTPATAFPWAIAGLARGGWSLADAGQRVDATPFPGEALVHAPLAWFDSLAWRVGEDAAWDGYEASFARLSSESVAARVPRARSVFGLLNGDFGLDETALRIERGDSLRSLAVAALSGTHGERGALGLAGRHQWGVTSRWRRGRHLLEAAYAQRGTAARLAGNEEEAADGGSGGFDYDYRAARWRGRLSVARGYDAHLSFLPARDTLTWSRRDAGGERVAGEAELHRGADTWGARVLWGRSRVRRDRAPAFEHRASAIWAAARVEHPTGEGTLEFQLGAGHHRDFGGWDAAPGFAYRFHAAPFSGRAAIERMLVPVASDLAPGTAPFLQRTWLAGLEVAAGEGAPRRASAGFWMGTTRDRAIVSRLPLEEQWLRAGAVRDPQRYDFGLLLASAEWRAGHAGLGAEGFALVRDASALQPRVDPSHGARGHADWSFRAYQGDLGVTLRAEAEGTGAREAETAPPRRVPSFVSFGAAVVFTIGDAVITARARNLEGRVREETWIDTATGLPARGTGREFRFALQWRLFN